MSLSRLDFSFYKEQGAKSDSSSLVAINPSHCPGNLLCTFSQAARASISSHVAAKLATEHFVLGALDFCEKTLPTMGSVNSVSSEQSLAVIEAAFRNANSSVYEFGHRMAAGGKMASSLLGFMVAGSSITAGRVGVGSVYLFRQGQIFPFFECDSQLELTQGAFSDQQLENLVGARSVVSVELASVPFEPEDQVYCFSTYLTALQEERLGVIASRGIVKTKDVATNLADSIFTDPESNVFTLCIGAGPDAIYLGDPLVGAPILPTADL